MRDGNDKTHLFALGNEGDNHPEVIIIRLPVIKQHEPHIPVEIIKEREQVKAELDETLFLMPREGAEYLRCVVHVVLVSYS